MQRHKQQANAQVDTSLHCSCPRKAAMVAIQGREEKKRLRLLRSNQREAKYSTGLPRNWGIKVALPRPIVPPTASSLQHMTTQGMQTFHEDHSCCMGALQRPYLLLRG